MWQDCTAYTRAAHTQMEQAVQQVQQVKGESFSGCSFCRAPQAICHLWTERYPAQGTKTASFQRVGGGQCQFPQVVVLTLAAIISQRIAPLPGGGREWGWIQEEISKVPGFGDGRGSKEENWNRLWRWLRGRVVSNSIETSRMVWVMYHLG